MNPVDRNGLSSAMMAMRGAVLERNAALRQAAEAISPGGAAGGVEQHPRPFAAALEQAVGQVNAAQAEATSLASQYERGTTTDIAAVMMARQRASVGFEATLQVRNKLLSAYQDIVNMPL